MPRKAGRKQEKPLIITVLGIAVVIGSVIWGFFTKEGQSESGGATNTPIIITSVVETGTSIAGLPGTITTYTFGQGFGAEKGFWQVYFTAPTGSNDSSTYVGGIDERLIAAINNVQSTLDIVAFEWNNPRLTQAVLDARERGVQVRMVVDDEYTIVDNEEAIADGVDSPFQLILDAGIPVVNDDRGGLMHNKFMIMDGAYVWTGSMNYSMNCTYRNNNNMFVMRSQPAVAAYQAEFNEMFLDHVFASKRSANNSANFTQDGINIQIYFSPEDDPVPALVDVVNNAQSSIRFMAFSFTLDEVGAAVLARSEAGVSVEGIFEVVGSETEDSEMTRLFCAGLPVFQDGNPARLHHKVFIIDEAIVVLGSFNFSDSAANNNDENMVIVHDPDLAAQFLAEYARLRSQAVAPSASDLTCP